MIRPLALLCTVGFALPAFAQRAGLENTPDQCSDHADNDGNGLVDCEDPKCKTVGVCRFAPTVEVEGNGDQLTAQGQIVAGAVMLVLGPALGAASSAIYVDAHQQSTQSKQILEYTMGSVMVAAGFAISVSGSLLVKKGVKRRHDDAEMGLALGPTRVAFRVTF